MTTRFARPKHRKVKNVLWHVDEALPNEVLVFCPTCKALDVVRFTGEKMIPTRRFTQQMDKVYHACGSTVPCRLHSLSGRRTSSPGSPGHRLTLSTVAVRRKAL